MRNIVPVIFYGNLFYGLCALSLCLETNLQHHLPPNGPHFYFLIFAITVVYYTRIYYKSKAVLSGNERVTWYNNHRSQVKAALVCALVAIVADALFVTLKFRRVSLSFHVKEWALLTCFPLVAYFYTFKSFAFLKSKQLRSIGWLKPFFIGFAWSGLVTIYPVIFRQMQSQVNPANFIYPSLLFWFQNFLFISALAVMFDVKDFMTDIRYQLKTYPALFGITLTIKWVIVPLALMSLAVLWMFLWQGHASTFQIAVQTIPYIFLLAVTNTFRRRSILFYLVVVDGLMLLKGVCGITSILFL